MAFSLKNESIEILKEFYNTSIQNKTLNIAITEASLVETTGKSLEDIRYYIEYLFNSELIGTLNRPSQTTIATYRITSKGIDTIESLDI